MKLKVESSDRIAVAGATGRTGRLIVQKLIALGFEKDLCLLVRDSDFARDLFPQELAVVECDVREYASLLPALARVTTVISAIGSQTPVGRNCPQHVDYEGVANLVRAAEETGVTRFILISSIAVTQPEHPLNRFGKILEWKRKGEQILQSSRLSHTIIRPGGLKDSPGGQSSLTFDRGDHIMGMLSRADLAEVCVQTLLHPESAGLTFEAIESGDQELPDWDKVFGMLSSTK